MMYAKFQDHRTPGPEEEDILRLYHNIGVAAILVM